MKIEQISEALCEIKSEDADQLRKLEEEEKSLRSKCALEKDEREKAKEEYKTLEQIEKINSNTLKFMHMILQGITVPIGLFIIILAFSLEFYTLPISLFLFGLICITDATYTLMVEYPKIVGKNVLSFKDYIDAFKKLFDSKKKIRTSLISKYITILNLDKDISLGEAKLHQLVEQIKDLKKELSRIEGYIASVEYIVEKQYFEELSDSMDIVQYVKERELKKVVNK